MTMSLIYRLSEYVNQNEPQEGDKLCRDIQSHNIRNNVLVSCENSQQPARFSPNLFILGFKQHRQAVELACVTERARAMRPKRQMR
jgi:hypothetical protein